MNKILIAIERNDGKYFKFNSILKKFNLDSNNVYYIIYFGSSDGKIIEKQLTKTAKSNLIDIERYDIDRSTINQIEIETKNIIDANVKKNKNIYLKNITSMFNEIIFNNVKDTLILEYKLNKIIKLENFTNFILIGKKHSEKFAEEGLVYINQLNYYEKLSFLIKNIAANEKIKLTLYKTDRIFKKRFYKFFRNFILVFGFIKRSLGFYIADNFSNKDENNYKTLVLLRGKVHVNLSAKLLEKDYNNLFFIIDLNNVNIDYLSKYFQDICSYLKFKKISIFSLYSIKTMLKNIFRFYNMRTILKKEKKDCNIVFSSPYLFIVLYFTFIDIIKKSIAENKISNFITYEETNLLGTLFSKAISPIAKESIIIQHGFTVSYYDTMPLISNERWVWGEYFKDQYILRGEDKNRIKIKGKELLYFNKYKCFASNEIKKTKILLAPEYNKDINTVEKWIINSLKLLENLETNKIFISIHPYQPLLDTLKKNIEKLNLNVNIVSSFGYKEISDIDIVICGNTTVGFEAALLGKLVFCYLLNDDEIIYDYLNHPYIIVLEKPLLMYLNNINNDNVKQNHLDFIKKYAGIEL